MSRVAIFIMYLVECTEQTIVDYVESTRLHNTFFYATLQHSSAICYPDFSLKIVGFCVAFKKLSCGLTFLKTKLSYKSL